MVARAQVKPELATVNATTGQESSPAPQAALGRVAFDRELEVAINEQIKCVRDGAPPVAFSWVV